MTIELELWMIPMLITVISIVAAFFFIEEDNSSGFLAGIGSVFSLGINLIAALAVSLVSWIIYAIFFGAG